jgi:hypothetical protein
MASQALRLLRWVGVSIEVHTAGATTQEAEQVYTDQVLKTATVRLTWLLATLAGLTVPALLVWAFQASFPHVMALVPIS